MLKQQCQTPDTASEGGATTEPLHTFRRACLPSRAAAGGKSTWPRGWEGDTGAAAEQPVAAGAILPKKDSFWMSCQLLGL